MRLLKQTTEGRSSSCVVCVFLGRASVRWSCVAPGVFGLCNTFFYVTDFRVFFSYVTGLNLPVFLGRVERTGLTYVNRVVPVLWHSSS